MGQGQTEMSVYDFVFDCNCYVLVLAPQLGPVEILKGRDEINFIHVVYIVGSTKT